MGEAKLCALCGVEFERGSGANAHVWALRRYCSDACRYRAKRRQRHVARGRAQRAVEAGGELWQLGPDWTPRVTVSAWLAEDRRAYRGSTAYHATDSRPGRSIDAREFPVRMPGRPLR